MAGNILVSGFIAASAAENYPCSGGIIIVVVVYVAVSGRIVGLRIAAGCVACSMTQVKRPRALEGT